MKKFSFSLERVLSWRRTQARMEEMKLERLLARRRDLEAQRKTLEGEYGLAQAALVRAGPVSGSDLEALDWSRKAAVAQAVRVDVSLRALEREIAAQTEVVTARRRDARLIEQLREEKARAWKRAFLKELDQQAEEAHLIRVRAGQTGYNSPL